MSNKDTRKNKGEQENVFYLEPGYMYIGSEKSAIKTVLGNCVSVCLWDDKLRFGGMNHFLYPVTHEKNKATAKFGNIATKVLINKMFTAGSIAENIVAQIVGGAEINNDSGLGIENVNIARKILQKEKIEIKSEDIGGYLGRKVIFDVHNGHLMVIKVHQIRTSDWKDYVLDK